MLNCLKIIESGIITQVSGLTYIFQHLYELLWLTNAYPLGWPMRNKIKNDYWRFKVKKFRFCCPDSAKPN